MQRKIVRKECTILVTFNVDENTTRLSIDVTEATERYVLHSTLPEVIDDIGIKTMCDGLKEIPMANLRWAVRNSRKRNSLN